jgi:predicted transport protein
MYSIEKDNKTIIPLIECDFSSIQVKERQDIEEWVEKEPNILGEGLLIIQKEFAGFDDTKERLDLLAIDENGYLVIIELKRDDSGKDVNWQAIKYAAYCSTLTNDDIFEIYSQYSQYSKIEATTSISRFLDVEVDSLELNQKQRIILVSKQYRKEVLATVMWLLDNNIDVKCVEIQPYKDKTGNLFIVPKVILPTPDTEEYRIKRNRVRMEHEKILHSGIYDRKYWEIKSSKETVGLIDKLHNFIQEIDSAIELNYNKNYIGLTKGGKSNNFVSFKGKKGYLLVQLRFPEAEKYEKEIVGSGFEIKYDNIKHLYLIHVTEKEVINKEDGLKKLLKSSYDFALSK